MRILIPIGLLFIFVLFVVVVVIQSLFEEPHEKENKTTGNSTAVGETLKICLETAKIMPLPILNCMRGDCKDLQGIFQCQKMPVDNNELISGVSEEILCRNITKVLSCDKNTIDTKKLYNNNDCNYQEFTLTNICFSTRGVYHCDRNNCQRVASPSISCHCLVSPLINELPII